MLRTFLSLAAGLLAVVLFLLLGTWGLGIVGGDSVDQAASGRLPKPEWILLGMLLRVMSGVAGGYLAAAIARHSGVRHAVIVGALAASIGSIVLMLEAGGLPLWYSLLAGGLFLPAAAMGGAIRAERTRRPGRLGGAQPGTV